MAWRLLAWLTVALLSVLVAGLLLFAALSELNGAVATALVFGVGAAFVLGAVLVLAVGLSLARIEAAARHAGSGDLDIRLSAGGLLPELSSSLNDLIATLGGRLEEAAQERSRLERVLNSSIDAVLAVDADGRITFANAAAETLFERSQEDLVGNPFGWVVPEEQAIEALRGSRERGEARSVTSERQNHQFLQVVTTPIAGGGDWAALAVFHDVTDVKRTEQVRRDFIANVSHELRTPLASIKSLIETLEGGALDEPDVAKDFLERANQEVDRLVRLVEELLELSRIESGGAPIAAGPVDLAAVIGGSVERLQPQARAQGVELSWEDEGNLPVTVGDAERLERVMVNLLLNALKFTPADGSVVVRAERQDYVVVVSVTDTGAGIAADDLPRVFERFFKADRARGSAGTGLGLAIVKHTVEAHGGRVSAHSEEGRGATFVFTIPVAERESPA